MSPLGTLDQERRRRRKREDLFEQKARVARAASTVRSSVENNLSELLETSHAVSERFIFCGGKGGVGKTTSSAAIAVKLAEEGHSTLVVSTDPAHSLGDAFDEDLRGKGPVCVGASEELPLHAMEIDTENAIKRFSDAISGLDLISLAQEAGISSSMLESVGADEVLQELSSLFENPPPGIDEIVAISQVVNLIKRGDANFGKGAGRFDRIVFDTAPTGHTLRLLSLPKFLDGFVAKTIKLRARVGGLLNSITSMLGMENTFDSKLNKVVDKLEEFQREIQSLKALFQNPEATEFIIVTIPTQMAVRESERLVDSLKTQQIASKHIIINKLLGTPEGEEANAYLSNIKSGQEQCLSRLEGSLASKGIKMTTVPYFDSEVTGVVALQYMGDLAFKSGWEDLEVLSSSSSSSLPDNNDSTMSLEEKLKRMEAEIEKEATQAADSMPKFVIMGGKGGVGKTSCSSALALSLAMRGAKTAVVSTDPAHSLGDSLQMHLSGNLQPVPALPENVNLYAMEIDTKQAIDNFKSAVQGMVEQSRSGGGGGVLSSLKLEEFVETLETPPPGADELVALSEMLKIVNRGTPDTGEQFDYVVIDTAPTGHTLRLLALPEFLNKFFTRLRKIRDKASGAGAFLSMFAPSGEGEGEEQNSIFSSSYSTSEYDDILSRVETTGKTSTPTMATNIDRLAELQDSMNRVTNLLKDPTQSQFCIVTIPTVLAVAESERLVHALEQEKIRVSHVIANQVIASEDDVSDRAYLNRIGFEQEMMTQRVNKLAKSEQLNVVKVPYFDAEVRGLDGLRILGNKLFKA